MRDPKRLVVSSALHNQQKFVISWRGKIDAIVKSDARASKRKRNACGWCVGETTAKFITLESQVANLYYWFGDKRTALASKAERS